MIDLADIAKAWETASPEDLERYNRQFRPQFTYYPQLTDEEAIAMLRQFLALRTVWLRSRDQDVELERQAQHLIVKLAEGVAGWAYSPRGIVAFTNRSWPGFVETHPEEHRQLLIEWLAEPLPFMPPGGPDLLRALDELWVGKIHPLLRPRKGGRRGDDPRTRACIQEALLAWIEWQVAAKSKTRTEALAEVAGACRLTPQAVRKWKARLPLDPSFQEPLTAAARVGEMQAKGDDPAADPSLEQLAARLERLDIRILARDLRRAAAKRTIDRLKKRRTANR